MKLIPHQVASIATGPSVNEGMKVPIAGQIQVTVPAPDHGGFSESESVRRGSGKAKHRFGTSKREPEIKRIQMGISRLQSDKVTISLLFSSDVVPWGQSRRHVGNANSVARGMTLGSYGQRSGTVLPP